MKLYIKHMVSLHCKMSVKAILEELGVDYVYIDLGEIEIKENTNSIDLNMLKSALHNCGLELMDDKKAILTEKIKNIIVEMIHYENYIPKVKNSEYISEKMNYDYNYLSTLFSEVTGITIEHSIILNKIERAKELLLYDELSLTQIADKLNYSGVAHLSNQFKKVTGLTPSFFKKLKLKKRVSLEDI
ncbi:MAG: AraC family transcriptional regulator [Limnohabitans sp.]|nr:AraC family transcriptional regulator [Limnohabitans sp.]